MRTLTIVLSILLAVAAVADAGLVSERWGFKGVPATHAGAVKLGRSATGQSLVIDLSAIPAGAKVVHASLACFTSGNVQPDEPAAILAPSGKKLALEAPWYRSFDATAAVQAAAGKTLTLSVERFDGWTSNKTYLDVRYEGKAANVPAPIEAVRVAHHDGQTFVMFKEHPAYRPAAEKVFYVSRFASGHGDNVKADGPGAGHAGKPNLPAISLRTLRDMQGLDSRNAGRGVKIFRVKQVPAVTYRVYRHAKPITAGNIASAELLGEVAPLSGYDHNMSRITYKGEFTGQLEIWDSVIGTWCYDDYKPVLPGEGLFVHTATKAGKAHYAATCVLAGTENVTDLGGGAAAELVTETVAPPRPVLQRVQLNRYRKEVPEFWHTLWTAPPLANLPGTPYHVVVTVPPSFKPGDPMIISGFSADFNMMDHNVKIPPTKELKLFVQSQLGYFDSLSYSNGRGTLKSFRESKVDYFAERYLLTMIRWCQDKWRPQRSGLVGNFMHFGVRHPEIFGRLTFGTYTPSYDYQWSPASGALRRNLGPRDTAVTVDGRPAWQQYNISWYIGEHPERDIPFMYLISGTGKDSGHTSEFGWQDDPRGWAGLNRGRQTFVAKWGRISGEVDRLITNMKWDRSVPAFSNGSLNDNPGNGDPTDGDPYGQINGWLLWDPASVVDKAGEWSMTVSVASDCRADRCTVDVTPRKTKLFKPRPGASFKWTNASVADGKVVGKGVVEADRFGLVTLEKIAVTKGGNRLALGR